MYTETPVNKRWNLDITEADFREHSAQNFVCVKYDGASDKWMYDSNWEDETDRQSNVSWHVFIPAPSDILVAVFDFYRDMIYNLNGQYLFRTYRGMRIGYNRGDLSFFPDKDMYGVTDDGEVKITGTFFLPNSQKETANDFVPLMPVRSFTAPTFVNGTMRLGVKTGEFRCTYSTTGSGFVMFSLQDVNERWNLDTSQDDFRRHTAQNFVCVRRHNERWEYDSNWKYEPARRSNVSWHEFHILGTDVLVAGLDFQTKRLTDFKGSNMTYKSIRAGYKDGDLSFLSASNSSDPNVTNASKGLYRVAGSWIAPWLPPPRNITSTTTTTTRTATPNFLGGAPGTHVPVIYNFPSSAAKPLKCGYDDKRPGFIMMSPTNLKQRFKKVTNRTLFFSHPGFLCIRMKHSRWQFNAWVGANMKSEWFYFLPDITDVVVAATDFNKGTVKSMKAQRARSYGLQFGFKKGDMRVRFVPDKRNKFKKRALYELSGHYLVSWGHEPRSLKKTRYLNTLGNYPH
eukprot:TRINITY_DN1200_c0_g1_i5.p1 TRINITY_DN1200_c0_g1~~TRINITY_DN1200_c0_g1_i5.p1  ORF type:complete len:585 (-),score=62.31 TRINITY_DN1200_c0_g1_i5:106-1641(-)